jgi:alpha-D-ribose 1-methylphosphonate 5-triphosphate synthase subunit PhnG
MTQGRMGGDGRAFNLGEITVTRCSVKVQDGAVGHAVVTGRAPRHAELAATLDALLQDDTLTAYLEKTVIGPLAVAHAKRRDEVARKAAATRVEFFTLVRAAAS